MHNQFLDTIASENGFDTMDINTFLFDFANYNLNWGDLTEIISLSDADSIVTYIWNYTIIGEHTELIESIGITSISLNAALVDLFSILEDNSQERSYEDFIDSIKMKEQTFLVGSWSTNDSIIYLGASSIIRHSSYYWYKVMFIDLEESPYYQYVLEIIDENELNKSSSRWNWRKFFRGMAIVGADAAGYALTAWACASNPATAAFAPSAGALMGRRLLSCS